MQGTDMLAQYSFAVAITFGLLGLLGWLASRYSQKIQGLPRGSSTDSLAIVGRINLGAQHQLLHVRWKNQEMLIATSPQGARLIANATPAKKPQ